MTKFGMAEPKLPPIPKSACKKVIRFKNMLETVSPSGPDFFDICNVKKLHFKQTPRSIGTRMSHFSEKHGKENLNCIYRSLWTEQKHLKLRKT